MLVLPLGTPGVPADTDAPADPSEEGGADFAALMAAMAATALNPPPVPPPAPVAEGTPTAGEGTSVPTGPAALPAFGWAAGGASPMFAPKPATPAAPPAQPETLPAPALTPAAASPAVEPVEPAAEATEALEAVSAPGSGPAKSATRAETPSPSEDISAEAAVVPGSPAPSLDRPEAAGESSRDEAPASSKPLSATGPAHDRVSISATHPGGSLLAAGAARTAEAPAQATPVQHPPVVEQVVSVVEPLRHRGDGHHELTLDLRPAELGPIRVEVSIDRGTVHLALHAEQASTGTLLDRALPELRAALEEAGLVAGRLGVGPGDREGGRPPADSHPAEGDEPKAARPVTAAAVASVRPAVVPAAGALDLLL